MSQFIYSDDSIMFADKKVAVTETVFQCYYFTQKGEFERARSYLCGAAANSAAFQYMEQVLWLWSVAEYANKSNDIGILADNKVLISDIISLIGQNWSKPVPSWNYKSEAGIYLVNIAAAYGALQSVNNSLNNGEAQKIALDIRKFMFENFLKGGRVISKLGSEAVNGDICLLAVPFALLDAGNQILVESIKIAESQLISNGVRLTDDDTWFGGCVHNDLTCLMAWYYSERGDIARAKALLSKADQQFQRDGRLLKLDLSTRKQELLYQHWEQTVGTEGLEVPLTYIFHAIASENIAGKSAGVKKGGVEIRHTGEGLGNSYIFSTMERFPAHPEEGQHVLLRAVTEPFSQQQKVEAVAVINGNESKRAEMILKSAAGEKYWEADIGSFKLGDRVDYYFDALDEAGSSVSQKFSFTVRKWIELYEVDRISPNPKGCTVYFSEISGRVPCMGFSSLDDSKMKLSFSVENGNGLSRNTSEKLLAVKVGENMLSVDKDSQSITISGRDRENILRSHPSRPLISLLTDGDKEYKVRYSFEISGEEKFLGLGERYSHIEYTGQELDNYVFNQYKDQGLKTYIPIPFVVSTAGYGIYFDTLYNMQFSFGTKLSNLAQYELTLEKDKKATDAYFLFGAPKDILMSYSEIAGKPVLPPKWSFGPWMSSNNWDSQKEVDRQLELGRRYEIPSTVMVLEQWSDEATFYIFNDARYQLKDGKAHFDYEDFTFPEWGRWPNPKEMVDMLHSEGVKLLLWQAPVMKYMDGISHAQRDEDERAMLELGYHIKHKNGEPYRVPYYEWFKRSLIPDFTNPAAREWWLHKRLYLVEQLGIDGFKTDGGECIYGSDLEFYDKTDGEAMRNRFPDDYTGSFNEFINKHRKGNGITFSRAGYTSAHKHPLHWAGDERSTFAAFVSSVRAGLNSSMSGIPFWGWDLAGFHGGIPTAELYIRSVEMAAFCPVMQYHAETKGEFNQDRTPWNIAERTGNSKVIEVYKKYADLRMNLLPYIFDQAIKTSRSGIPMMRAMAIEYPADKNCRELYQQYFFGDSLLVAPVMKESSTLKEVYLPEGSWIGFYAGEQEQGPVLKSVCADFDEIPVFIKEDSIIPLNLSETLSLCSHVSNEVDCYKSLCFMCYLVSELEYRFEDDLGNYAEIKAGKNNKSISLKITTNITEFSMILRGLVDIADSRAYINDNGDAVLKLCCQRDSEMETEILLKN